MSPEEVTRVNQVYRAYLNAIYEIDYNHEKHARLAEKSKHIDFLIALGAASSGGSGLVGILSSIDGLAWLCGLLTTISTVGALAKGTYDWTGRLKASLDMIEFYTPLKHGLEGLREDIIAKGGWCDDFEQRYTDLRASLAQVPVSVGKGLAIEEQRKIQNRIKNRLNYKSWPAWQES